MTRRARRRDRVRAVHEDGFVRGHWLVSGVEVGPLIADPPGPRACIDCGAVLPDNAGPGIVVHGACWSARKAPPWVSGGGAR
jgi:hypothetical protein